ncbi:lysoplasmalogenase [Ectopseudomonas mendocina]|uniref:Lysoplasmalogenase n=1 Tax=Ectopseudomonas mendocina TaxID=300 RepID=A0ABZ2RH20_ECTME
MRYLLLALMAAAAYLYAQYNDLHALSFISKGIPVILLILWLREAPASLYRRWISIGLLFSLAGDLLLDWPDDLFVFGLSAFLIAHLAYLSAYIIDCKRPAWLALLVALLTGGGMFAIVSIYNLGPLLIPVGCYALVISIMLWRALARLTQPGISVRSAQLAAGGAALFVLSDGMIAINRFVWPFEASTFTIITTYWLGQWGIAASAFSQATERPDNPS